MEYFVIVLLIWVCLNNLPDSSKTVGRQLENTLSKILLFLHCHWNVHLGRRTLEFLGLLLVRYLAGQRRRRHSLVSFDCLGDYFNIIGDVLYLRIGEDTRLHLLKLLLKVFVHLKCHVIYLRISWIVKIAVVPDLPHICRKLSRRLVLWSFYITVNSGQIHWVTYHHQVISTSLFYRIDRFEEWGSTLMFLQSIKNILALTLLLGDHSLLTESCSNSKTIGTFPIQHRSVVLSLKPLTFITWLLPLLILSRFTTTCSPSIRHSFSLAS